MGELHQKRYTISPQQSSINPKNHNPHSQPTSPRTSTLSNINSTDPLHTASPYTSPELIPPIPILALKIALPAVPQTLAPVHTAALAAAGIRVAAVLKRELVHIVACGISIDRGSGDVWTWVGKR